MYRTSLKLRKFDPTSSLKKPFNMVILGHKHTGKSTLMRDMLYRLHNIEYPRVVVFSGTEEGNEFFSKCIPQPYIHGGLDIDKLTAIVNNQRRVIASCRDAESKLGRPTGVDSRLLIVLDDVMYKKNATKTEIFAELFMNGRHWNISIMISCQYVMSLDIACRSNVDILVCLRESVPRNRQKIHDNFFGCFARKQDFYNVLDQCTQNYEALILDNTEPNLEVEKCVMWYKAELSLPDFMFGSKRFKNFASTGSK